MASEASTSEMRTGDMDDMVLSKAGNVTLIANATCPLALRGIKNEISILFDIVTEEVEGAEKRRPLSLAIVLDVSGSMAAENKLVSCKRAICHVLELLAPSDLAHLIVYDSKCKQIFINESTSKENLARLKAETNKVTAGSMTNMWIGLEAARDILASSDEKYERRVLLFSDGQVNEGKFRTIPTLSEAVSTELLERVQAKVTTFGVGTSYNEDLMKQLAEVGVGAYYYIRTADDCESIVDSAVRSLVAPAAFDAVLKVRGQNSGTVTSIIGYQDLVKGATLGDLRGANTRSVIAIVEVVPTAGVEGEEIVKYEFSYKDVQTKEIIKVSELFRVGYTDDEEEVEKRRNDLTIAKVLLAKTAEIDQMVVTALEKNDVEGAKKHQQETIVVLQEAKRRDRGGQSRAKFMLEDAEKQLEKLKVEGASKNMKKTFHSRGYTKRRNSSSHMDAQLY